MTVAVTTAVSAEVVIDRWDRARARALDKGLTPDWKDETTAVVQSASDATKDYAVRLNEFGRIVWCPCLGWGGRSHPCQHAGAVANDIVDGKASVAPVMVTQTTRDQVYRDEAVA